MRASTSYQTYLQAVAALMVQHLPLPQFKQRLRGITMPPALGQLVNSYQLGVMATEFARTGQITATRLQIVPRYLVADLNRFSRQLAAQRQRDWDDDVFNAALGCELTADQRRQRLTQLRDCWEGRQLSDACYATLLRLRESWRRVPGYSGNVARKAETSFSSAVGRTTGYRLGTGQEKSRDAQPTSAIDNATSRLCDSCRAVSSTVRLTSRDRSGDAVGLTPLLFS
ncbi:hypothetical protein L3X07_06025 [Levilactobacillus brevis]|nr:hypothetical protein [Levilactobacillus brevis]